MGGVLPVLCSQTSIIEHQKGYSPDKTNDLIDAFLHEMEARKEVETSSFTGSHTFRCHTITHLIVSQSQLCTLPTKCIYVNCSIFWDITPCSLVKVNRRFGGTYRLHLQGRISRARYQRILLASCFHAGVLLGLFDPEDGGDMFLRNVG
jgi:hypothetical protein